tara:strand:+ start:2105 stop:2767 length:663 start_codon:yes stop_codon:yes gene_type:complete
METTFIYTLNDPDTNEVRYVGKSDNPQKRLYMHLWRESKTHKWSWIKSLKDKGLTPLLEVLDEVPLDDWRFWEKYWIAQLKVWGCDLVNHTEGGEGFASGELNPAHLPHVKALTSKRQRDRVISEETKEKISKSLTGRKNPEHSKWMMGRKQSKESIAKSAMGSRGKNSKINEAIAKEIKIILRDNPDKLSLQGIADKFGVGKDIIKHIKYGNTWTYIQI